MGRSESDWINCRKHPRNRNSTGVCPYCLRERLMHLSSPTFSFLNLACSSSSTSSSTPFYSSSDDSELSSPSESPLTYETVQGSAKNVSFLIKRNDEPLMKSRSLVHFVGRRRKEGLLAEDDDDRERRLRVEKGKMMEIKMEEDCKEGKKEKKVKGFWAKILMKNGIKNGIKRGEKGEKSWVLEHSRTLREKPAAKWVRYVN